MEYTHFVSVAGLVYNDTVIDNISWENGSTVETVVLIQRKDM